MANKNAPFGARAIKELLGVRYTGAVTTYNIPATDSEPFFVGDFVKPTGTAIVGVDGNSYPTIARAAAGDTLLGFVNSFKPDSNYLNQIYRTASTLRTAEIFDDPFVVFEAQVEGDFQPDDVGVNVDIEKTNGSTVTGLSAEILKLSTKTSGSAQVRILRLMARADNEYGNYAKVQCIINEHIYKGTSGV